MEGGRASALSLDLRLDDISLGSLGYRAPYERNATELSATPITSTTTAVSPAAAILGVPGNDACADCSGTKPPVWASTNLGTVICIACAGVHRKLGSHVSKVLSLHLDDWTADQVAHMLARGNRRVNAELEASVPPAVTRPSEHSSAPEREAFIRAKYALLSFAAGGDGRLPHVAAASASKAGSVEFAGVLFVRVVCASNLVSMDLLSPSDPYCVLKLAQQSMRTRTVRDDNAPSWGETLSLNVIEPQQVLLVEVWDADELGSDQLIGTAHVPIAAACTQPSQPTPITVELRLGAEAARFVRGNLVARCLPCLALGERLGGVYRQGQPSTVSLELTFTSLSGRSCA
ncbi:hypothetical protein KFE25_000247 [Diacronema lutheri]|uniref:Uncharacterized protein n=2 Tax=Diacronema lutheri TaxID=2081491 RepID=A0A8J6C8Z8_DIALT|nr:hypothetical protein KFE25_000247 [Diacronema lutheri]